VTDDNAKQTNQDETLPPLRHTSDGADMGIVLNPEGAGLQSEGFTGSGSGSTSAYEPTGDLAEGLDGPEGTGDSNRG